MKYLELVEECCESVAGRNLPDDSEAQAVDGSLMILVKTGSDSDFMSLGELDQFFRKHGQSYTPHSIGGLLEQHGLDVVYSVDDGLVRGLRLFPANNIITALQGCSG